MKKTFLKIAAISIISVSGVATFNIIQPTTYAQSKKTFSKNVQGKWTNQNGDKFTIKNPNAKLKVTNGKHKGVYKFKVTKQNKNGYKLKAQGKRIAKTSKLSLTNINNGIIEFKYGKQKIKFTNQSLKVTEQSTTTSTPTNQSQQPANTTSQNNQNQNTDNDPYNIYENPQTYSTRGF